MSEADIRDLSDSYYLGFVGQSGFDGEPFETLESRSKFLSCMSDDDEVANAINPETCLPLLKGAIESTSDPVMVLRVTRAASERWGEELVREQFPLSLEEAESQFRATRAVLFWCVPPSEAARVWDRMAKEAALEFMPAIVEENASCPIDSLYAALSRNR